MKRKSKLTIIANEKLPTDYIFGKGNKQKQ